MKTYVSVECSQCHKEIKEDRSVYCLECLDDKDNKLHIQDKHIKRLHNEIKELEVKILTLEL